MAKDDALRMKKRAGEVSIDSRFPSRLPWTRVSTLGGRLTVSPSGTRWVPAEVEEVLAFAVQSCIVLML